MSIPKMPIWSGKRNIFLEEGKGLHVTFKKEDKVLSLVLKKEVIEEMNSLPDVEDVWEALRIKLEVAAY